VQHRLRAAQKEIPAINSSSFDFLLKDEHSPTTSAQPRSAELFPLFRSGNNPNPGYKAKLGLPREKERPTKSVTATSLVPFPKKDIV